MRSVDSSGSAGKKKVEVDCPGTVKEGTALMERSTRTPLESRMVRYSFSPFAAGGNDLEINAGDAQFFRQDGRKPGTGQDGVVKAQTELRQRPRFQRRVFRYFEFRNADGCQIPWRRFRFSHVGACRGLLDGFLDGIDGSAHRGFFHVIQQIKCSRSQQDGACASYQQGHHVAVAAKSACGLPA